MVCLLGDIAKDVADNQSVEMGMWALHTDLHLPMSGPLELYFSI